MSELPPKWVTAKVGELISLNPKNDCDDSTEVGFVPLQLLGTRYRDRHTFEKRPWSDVRRGYTHFANNDVLLARITPSFENGKAGIVRDLPNGLGAGSTEYFVCRPIPGAVIPEYLLAHFKTRRFLLEGEQSMTGVAGQQRVPKQYLLNSEILLAPLNEQKRIVDKLDALLARVDACHDRLDRVPSILKRFRQVVLAAAMSGQLTEDWRVVHPGKIDAQLVVDRLRDSHKAVGGHKAGNAAPPTEGVHNLSLEMFPSEWQLLELKEVVRPNRPITYGILKPGPNIRDGVSYIRVADYPNDQINLSTIRKTSTTIDKEFSRSRLEVGDIVLSIRGTVGRLVVIPPELDGANITQDSARLSLQPYVNRDFILWYLRSAVAQERMKSAEKGVAVRGINIGDVRALQIAIPSLEEQTEIVQRIETLFAYVDRIENHCRTIITQVNRLTPALLDKTFRGELVPQNPNDEPASVLLERIRVTKASGTIQDNKPRERADMEKKMTKRAYDLGPIDIAQALRVAGQELSSNDLFIAAGYPSEAEPEVIEEFFVAVRAALKNNEIVRMRRGDTDWFALNME